MTAPGGSSPLTRGKHLGGQRVVVRVRLIPAHAGKTHATCHRRHPPTAHPRSRGENARYVSPQASSDGSSPLTRGKLADGGTDLHQIRLIPAHAGKTPTGSVAPSTRRAHPRSRGENAPDFHEMGSWLGSSPLTRGKLADERFHGGARGLIPAHAGKTRTLGSRQRPGQAHPRSRGENRRRVSGSTRR